MAANKGTAIEQVVDALANFRQSFDNRNEFVRSSLGDDLTTQPVDTTEYWNQLDRFAWDMAADGTSLARAVAALLGQPELEFYKGNGLSNCNT